MSFDTPSKSSASLIRNPQSKPTNPSAKCGANPERKVSMQTSSVIPTPPEPQASPPERGRAWRIIAIVLTLHAALLGSVVLIQGCGKSDPVKIADGGNPSDLPNENAAVNETAATPAHSGALPPDIGLRTPEESLDGPATGSSADSNPDPNAGLSGAGPAPQQADPTLAGQTKDKPSPEDSAGSVPANPVPTVAPAAPVRYSVCKGDTLSKIARKYSVTVSELAGANKLTSTTPLKIGQKLIVPGSKAAAVAKAVSSPAAPAPKPAGLAARTMHTVKAKETAISIARRYGVTLQSLLQANHISDPRKLRVNQKLTIPVVKTANETPAPMNPTAPVQARDGDLRPTAADELVETGAGVKGI